MSTTAGGPTLWEQVSTDLLTETIRPHLAKLSTLRYAGDPFDRQGRQSAARDRALAIDALARLDEELRRRGGAQEEER